MYHSFKLEGIDHHYLLYCLPTEYYSLHINCGGQETTTNDKTKFEADLEARGATTFYSRENWALSSTGDFMDDAFESDTYIMATNSYALHNLTGPVSELYSTARVSPLSLTYYGLCLMNGNYTVKLHFAEIVFTNDSTFTSLGRRLFDVYLQVNDVPSQLKGFTLRLFNVLTIYRECRKTWY